MWGRGSFGAGGRTELGLTVPGSPRHPRPQGIFISRIAEGGAAHRAGTLQVGDRVLSVSGGSGACSLPLRSTHRRAP